MLSDILKSDSRRSCPRVRALALVLVMGWLWTTSSLAAQYYVAPDGNDGNPGTPADPLQTIQHAINQAGAGDTVLVGAGVYRELVRIERSGSRRGGFMTLRNVPGQRPVIDGSGLPIPDDESGLITISNANFIRVQGFQLTHYTSHSAAVPIGLFVQGRGHDIELLDNRINAIETFRRGCEGNALGIAIYGRQAPDPITRVLIRGNEVAYLKTGCSESVSINGNVSHFRIVDNIIHDNNNIGIDVIGHENMAPDAKYDIARQGVIAGNHVYNISSYDNAAYPPRTLAAGGIYVDGGRSILIEDNRVYRNDIGIELASEHKRRNTRNVTVRRNLIYDNRTAGLSIGGYAADSGGTIDCSITHNTFYKNDTRFSYAGEFQIQHNARRNVFTDNVVVANAQKVFINNYVDSTARPVISDRNIFYTESASANGEWQWRGRNYAGFENYRRTTGNDLASMFGEPPARDIAHLFKTALTAVSLN